MLDTYNVVFVSNRFSITTTVEAKDEEDAEAVARQTIIEEACLDVDKSCWLGGVEKL
jgi:hypothetical protein